MGKLENINDKSYIIYLTIGIIIFTILLAYIWNLTVDDAFISFRYAMHLAQGYGLVWNIGGTPVEGYSNFLWVLIFAILSYLKLDLILASKIIGLLSVFGILVFYWKFLRNIFQERKSALLGFGIAAALFLANPATAMHTVAGLETMLYTLLIVALSYYTYKIITTPQTRYYYLFSLSALLLSLLRFEGVLITISLIILLALLKYKNYTSFKFEKSFILPVIALFVIPVTLYMIIRYQYFHELFPMSFLAKSIVSNYFSKFLSNIYVFYTFFMRLLPFILVNMFLILSYKIFLKNEEIKKKYFSVILIFIVLFVAGNIVYLFTLLAMNYGDRLFYPSYVFIYLITSISLVLIFNYKNKKVEDKNHYLKTFLQVFMVILLLSANTVFISDLLYWHNYENTEMSSLIAVGNALQPYSEHNYTVATEYAGAIPYYSCWYHIDILGLNNKDIAGSQLSLNYIQKVKPDLIILKFNSQGELLNKKFKPLLDYAEENNYSTIKLPQDNFICYLNPKIKDYNEIYSTLNHIK